MIQSLFSMGYLHGKSVHAVDISENRLENVKRIRSDIVCHVDDATHLATVETGSIDFLTSTQVIEHVPDDREMIKEIARVLSDGGVAYITTVFKKRHARYFYRSRCGWAIDPTHVREYVEDRELLDRLTESGLKIECQIKTQISRQVMGSSVLSLIHAQRDVVARSRFLRLLKSVQIPVPGYYNWEIVCTKNRSPRPPLLGCGEVIAENAVVLKARRQVCQ